MLNSPRRCFWSTSLNSPYLLQYKNALLCKNEYAIQRVEDIFLEFRIPDLKASWESSFKPQTSFFERMCKNWVSLMFSWMTTGPDKDLDQLLKYPRKTVTWGTWSNQAITEVENYEVREWVWCRANTWPELFKKRLLQFSALSEVELWYFWFKKVDFDDVLSTCSEPAFGSIDSSLLRF